MEANALILTGPPGAGKTTVAGLVGNAYERAAHLESDDFFHVDGLDVSFQAHTFDATSDPPEETAARVVKRLRSGALAGGPATPPAA
jgi:uridine kinase